MAGYRKYSCKYPGCTSGYVPNKGHANKHFFTFPKNPKLHELWRNACKIEDPNLLLSFLFALECVSALHVPPRGRSAGNCLLTDKVKVIAKKALFCFKSGADRQNMPTLTDSIF
nr:PREDICTED: uncharacterized protein LOC107397973 [Tribolium castaneum]|eukprot:XP_015835763.1 PREDICTED: uncharacterized protein LOC107397973 [Tribolium castaneum]